MSAEGDWWRVVEIAHRELSYRSEMEIRQGQRSTEQRIRKLWAEAEARRPRKIRPIPTKILREA